LCFFAEPMSDERLNTCPICNSDAFSDALRVQDFLVSKKVFLLQECRSCGMMITNPRPDKASIGSYYQSENYVSHHDTRKGLIHFLYQTVKSVTLKSKYHLITGVRKSTRPFALLDYGCGTGSFTEFVLNKKNTVTGIEPDEGARSLAAKKTGNVFSDVSLLPSGQSYDVITLWHVLEHVHALNETLAMLTAHLEEKGVMLIAVPNRSSYDAKKLGVFWAAYDVPRHLYHFTAKQIELLMKRHGMKLVSTKPMWFDSFYVSMLSYKNKGSKLYFIRGVWTGLLSNLSALFTGACSSRIYIFRKISD